MIAIRELLITEYTERYILARDVSEDYAQKLRHRMGMLCYWCGGLLIRDLTADVGNAWLTEVASTGRSKRTMHDYRGCLLSVWLDAYESGHNDNPPRLKRFKRPRMIIEAYMREEIKQLLVHMRTLVGRHRDGNRRKDFWQAAVHVGYSCGPRRGDLLDIDRKHMSPDGVLSFVQNKTGYVHTVRLSREALEYVGRLRGDKLLPWPHQKDWFSKSFRKIRIAAGINRGSFKWIRRSAGSYAELAKPGSGPLLLGHRNANVFRLHYEDATITRRIAVNPPEL